MSSSFQNEIYDKVFEDDIQLSGKQRKIDNETAATMKKQVTMERHQSTFVPKSLLQLFSQKLQNKIRQSMRIAGPEIKIFKSDTKLLKSIEETKNEQTSQSVSPQQAPNRVVTHQQILDEGRIDELSVPTHQKSGSMSGSSLGPFSLKIKPVIKVSPKSSFFKDNIHDYKRFQSNQLFDQNRLDIPDQNMFNNASQDNHNEFNHQTQFDSEQLLDDDEQNNPNIFELMRKRSDANHSLSLQQKNSTLQTIRNQKNGKNDVKKGWSQNFNDGQISSTVLKNLPKSFTAQFK